MNRAVLGVIVVTAVLAVALGKYTFGRIDRLNVSWSVAWLKTLVIVVGIIALVAVIPGWVMTLEVVADMDRALQDVVGSGVFGAGLILSLWLLNVAQRDSRI
jgi:hypothetical protein